jgi:uncharacterized protein YukE
MNKQDQLVWEAHVNSRQAPSIVAEEADKKPSLRDPELTDAQADKIEKEIERLEKVLDEKSKEMKDSSYKYKGPHDRKDDDEVVERLKKKIAQLRKKWHGQGL